MDVSMWSKIAKKWKRNFESSQISKPGEVDYAPFITTRPPPTIFRPSDIPGFEKPT